MTLTDRTFSSRSSSSRSYCLRPRLQRNIVIRPYKRVRSQPICKVIAPTALSEGSAAFWSPYLPLRYRKRHLSASSEKENQPKRPKRVRFQAIRRFPRCSLDISFRAKSVTKCHNASDFRNRQDDVRKRRAFLDRIRAQEPDIDRGCIIRSSESDEVLIRENRAALSSKTLTRNQEEIVNVSRLGGQDVIGRGGFGEVSAWKIETTDGKMHRVAVKSFDPLDGGCKLAQAEASVMVEFEKLLNAKMLLWFVPRKLRSFPKDFPCNAIIMPLYENRKCISLSLYNLVFDCRLIQPTLRWISHIAAQVLEILVKLHTAGWAHGDLHAGNIMLANREIVLIDFSKSNRKNRPYVYSLTSDTDWIRQLDWIEPQAVIGLDCCSRAGDIWSFGKLIQILVDTCAISILHLRKRELEDYVRLNALIHLAYHKRQYRPDAIFLRDVLLSRNFASLNICTCLPDCEMLQQP